MEQFVLFVLSTVAMTDVAATLLALSAMEVFHWHPSQVRVLARHLIRQH